MDANTMTPVRRRRAAPRAARLGAGPGRQLAIFFGGVVVGGLAVAFGLEATRPSGSNTPPRGATAVVSSAAAAPTPSRPAADRAAPTSPAPAPVARPGVSATASVATAQPSAAASPAASSAAPSPAPPVDVGAALLARAARTSPQKGFGLQLGAYETEAEVAQVLGQHSAALEGLELWVLPVELEGKGTWHRLRVGRLATRREAEALRARLPEDVAAVAIVVSHR